MRECFWDRLASMSAHTLSGTEFSISAGQLNKRPAELPTLRGQGRGNLPLAVTSHLQSSFRGGGGGGRKLRKEGGDCPLFPKDYRVSTTKVKRLRPGTLRQALDQEKPSEHLPRLQPPQDENLRRKLITQQLWIIYKLTG